MFSEQERAFLRAQPLARLATVEVNGQPDVDAVGFEFDGEQFYIAGYVLERTRKYKNIAAGQTKVSLIIDELKTLEPFDARGIRLHGEAAIVTREVGYRGPGTYLAITPKVSWSWGIDEPFLQNGKFITKKITWE